MKDKQLLLTNIAALITGKEQISPLTESQQQYLRRGLFYLPYWVKDILTLEPAADPSKQVFDRKRYIADTFLGKAQEYARDYFDCTTLTLQSETIATMLKCVHGSHLKTPNQIADIYAKRVMFPQHGKFDGKDKLRALRELVSDRAALAIEDCQVLLEQAAWRLDFEDWATMMIDTFPKRSERDFTDYRDALKVAVELTRDFDKKRNDARFRKALQNTIYRYSDDLAAKDSELMHESIADARVAVIFKYLPLYANGSQIAWAIDKRYCIDDNDCPMLRNEVRQLMLSRNCTTMDDACSLPLGPVRLRDEISHFLGLAGIKYLYEQYRK